MKKLCAGATLFLISDGALGFVIAHGGKMQLHAIDSKKLAS
jgi:hypothetical protein